MKQVNFNNPGGFPLEQETLERLQIAYRSELYEALKRHLSIETDKNYIIAHATDKMRGWAVIHEPKNTGEGVLYPIKIGASTNYLKTIKTTTNLIYGDGNSQNAYTDYDAEYVSAKGTPITNEKEIINYYDLNTFKTVKSREAIEEILQSMNNNILDVEQDLKSYLPINGSRAMEGDLNLGNYRLSRLDTKENYDATVRAADFNFGSLSRRGLKHPDNYLGRALVDSSTQTETSLTLNYDADWENTRIGGKVYLNNLKTNINGSLLVLDGSNQVIKSNTLIDDLIKRITDLEAKESTAVPKGMIAMWGKPAPFPEGWEEYVPLRGRMPVGLNTNDLTFNNLLNFGGNKNQTLEISQIPSHTHKFTADIYQTGTGLRFGSNSGYQTGLASEDTESTGGGLPFSILNPYRVVYFIQYTGRPVDTIAPTAPTNLFDTRKGATFVDLAWTKSIDDRGVTNYLVYKDENLYATIEDINFFTVNGLSRSSSYNFYVIAQDAAGNLSLPSNTIRVKTNLL